MKLRPFSLALLFFAAPALLADWRIFGQGGANALHDGLTSSDGVLSINAGVEKRFAGQWSAELNAGVHRFQRSSSADPKLTQLTIGAKRWFGSGSVHPFVDAAAGIYRVEYLGTQVNPGANAGAGLFFEISPRWGVEGLWNVHVVNANDGNVTFSTLQLGVGLALRP